VFRAISTTLFYTVCFYLPTFPLLTSLVDVVTACRVVVDVSLVVETSVLGPSVVASLTRLSVVRNYVQCNILKIHTILQIIMPNLLPFVHVQVWQYPPL